MMTPERQAVLDLIDVLSAWMDNTEVFGRGIYGCVDHDTSNAVQKIEEIRKALVAAPESDDNDPSNYDSDWEMPNTSDK